NLIGFHEPVGTNIKCFRMSLDRLEGGRDIFCAPNFERIKFETEHAGRRLSFAQFHYGEGITDISQDRHSAQTWNNLAQDFDPLAGKLVRLDRQASDIAARPGQAGNKANGQGVPHPRKHNRDDRCRLLCREDLWRSRGDNDVDLEPDKLSRDLDEALGASFCPAIFDRNVAILRPPKSTQSLGKSGDQLASGRTSAQPGKSDGPQLRRLLRARHERPRSRAAEERDELAALHSITSSARASSVGGTS